MKKAWFRSSLFNIAFFGVTAVLSVLYIPGLLLPRKTFVELVKLWLRVVMVLEYGILGLRYKVIGRENLPGHGSFIIAAKHQSAYETLKLHLIFDDPAIILKKELLLIPLFGAYLKKSGAIAIDRGTPEKALRSVQAGVLRAKEEGRPIIIFPQGTRVKVGIPSSAKPYKPGIVRIQDVTDLPIVPLALNSGAFWGRNAWFKSPGTVTFQILRPIPPGDDRQTLMAKLEQRIEETTNILVAQARPPRYPRTGRVLFFKRILIAVLVLMACGFYALWWKMVVETIRTQYVATHPGLTPPLIEGFPGVMKIRLPEETITTSDGTMIVKDIFIHGLPLPLAPIELEASEVTIINYKWTGPLVLENIKAKMTYAGHTIHLKDSLLTKEDFKASAEGRIDITDTRLPVFDLVVRFINHQNFLNQIAKMGILDEQAARFMSAGFTALADERGIVSVPVTQRGHTLYAGPFAFAELPDNSRPPTVDPLSAAPGNLPAPSP